jgi:hypothetical protein
MLEKTNKTSTFKEVMYFKNTYSQFHILDISAGDYYTLILARIVFPEYDNTLKLTN